MPSGQVINRPCKRLKRAGEHLPGYYHLSGVIQLFRLSPGDHSSRDGKAREGGRHYDLLSRSGPGEGRQSTNRCDDCHEVCEPSKPVPLTHPLPLSRLGVMVAVPGAEACKTGGSDLRVVFKERRGRPSQMCLTPGIELVKQHGARSWQLGARPSREKPHDSDTMTDGGLVEWPRLANLCRDEQGRIDHGQFGEELSRVAAEHYRQAVPSADLVEFRHGPAVYLFDSAGAERTILALARPEPPTDDRDVSY